MGKSSARTGGDYRKLNNMLKDLKVMKSELCPDEKEQQQSLEMEGFDDFQKKKHQINTLLGEIRTDVDRLTGMRKELGADGRDNLTIRLCSENNARLTQATQLFTELNKIHAKDEKKKKIQPKDLADRRNMIILIGKDIQSLTNDNSRSKVVEDEEEAAMRARVEGKKAEKDEQTRQRRERMKKKKVKKEKMILMKMNLKMWGQKVNKNKHLKLKFKLTWKRKIKF